MTQHEIREAYAATWTLHCQADNPEIKREYRQWAYLFAVLDDILCDNIQALPETA